jgi:hypothetical protein
VGIINGDVFTVSVHDVEDTVRTYHLEIPGASTSELGFIAAAARRPTSSPTRSAAGRVAPSPSSTNKRSAIGSIAGWAASETHETGMTHRDKLIAAEQPSVDKSGERAVAVRQMGAACRRRTAGPMVTVMAGVALTRTIRDAVTSRNRR